MKKFANFIVKHKIFIIVMMLLLTIASIVAMVFVNVNSDILSYLPDGVKMTDGMNFMREQFDMQGDAIVGVSKLDYTTMLDITKQIAALKGVKPGGVIWIGSILEMGGISMGGVETDDIVDSIMSNEDVLNLFLPSRKPNEKFDKSQVGDFVVMLQLNVAPSSKEALAIIDTLNNTILKDYEHAIGGTTQMTKDIFDSTIGEIWKYIIVAVLVMFIILLLTSNSIVEPFVFMLTLGISIVVNMGTNIFLKDVSVVTFAASSILQLGLSMDYAIFLMHAFAEEKEKTLDENLAMRRAIPRTFSTIAASALTTVGGFLALFFMRFKIGADLGLVLAKGVFLSLVTVLVLQPCLMLITSKIHEKTTHRLFVPKLKKVGSFSISHRKIVVAICTALLIPTILMQSNVDLNYIKFVQAKENPTEIQKNVDHLGNSLILILPSNPTMNYAFLEDLKEVESVSGVMGAYSMVDKATGNQLYLGVMLGLIPDEASMIKNFLNTDYTMCTINLLADPESKEATAVLQKITELADKNFKGEKYYITGMSQAVEDLRGITPRDNAVVSIVSILIIFIILVFALRSFKLSALLIAVIEFGIFLNLSLSYVIGQEINFMAYIIISSIQLGATVDYAILYTVKYQRYLDIMPAKEAGYKALRDSGSSVITSVAIMAGCCLSVSLVTTNKIVSEITMMIARGSIISGILVMVLLPALLVLCTGNKKLKKVGKLEAKKLKSKEKRERKNDKKAQQIEQPAI
ncbi:MAG: MMPL family transporter [Clostridia bacterium]